MAHEITIREDGFAEAAFALEPAWHGLGKVLDHHMNSAEALTEAGLNWKIVQRSMAIGKPETYTDENTTEPQERTVWVPQPGLIANVREDNNVFMGVVTDHYKVVQNVDAFRFLDSLVENHEMKYESAFSLYGGRKVVVLAKMPGVQEVVKGDHIIPYILLSLAHDGTEAIKFGPVATRVVCANTYAMALREGKTKDLSIRHSGNIDEKLAQARNILGVANQQFAQYAEIGQELAKHQLSKEEWREFLDIMCPELDPRDPDYTDRRAEAVAETRVEIAKTYRNERNTLEGMANSCWAAYNAVVEHIDHLPRRGATPRSKAEARMNVCIYGIGRDMKKRALETAIRFAGIQVGLAV